MMTASKLLHAALAALLAASIAGCGIQRVNDSMRRSDNTAAAAGAMTGSMRNAQANPKRDTVVYSDKPWVSTRPITAKRGLSPNQDCTFIWRPTTPVTIQQAAQEVMRQCNLTVSITPDAMYPPVPSMAPTQAGQAGSGQAASPDMATMLFSNAAGATASGAFSGYSGASAGIDRQISGIAWKDKVSGFLDMITSRTGLSWRFDTAENAVQIYYLDMQVFKIYGYDDRNDMSSTVESGMATSTGVSSNGASGNTGGTGSSGISGQAGSRQSNTSTLNTSIFDGLQSSVQAMLTPGVGRMSLSRATGTMTVTDRPEVLRRVGQLISEENKSITTQVLLNVKVLAVSFSNKDQTAVDWNLVYQSLSDDWGITLANTVGGVDPSAISGSVSILDTANSAWAGSSAMIQALAQQGRVSTVRSPSVTTLNLQAAPIQIGQLRGYMAGSQVSNVADVGSTTSILPGTITSGYNMTLLPLVMPNDELLLKININMSSKPTFETVESGDSKAQFPSYDVQIFDQKVRLKNGETLVLSGFEQDSEDATKTGVGDPSFWGLGGSSMRSTERSVIVVLITPVVMARSNVSMLRTPVPNVSQLRPSITPATATPLRMPQLRKAA